jgi:hypothetical protein
MNDIHGQVAELKLLLAESRAQVKRLEALRVLGVEMRSKQVEYQTTRNAIVGRDAIRLATRWDQLADEADPVHGKPVVMFAHSQLSADEEIRRIGGGEAHAIPRGPYVDKLLSFAIANLTLPAACEHCAPDFDPVNYRHHEENKLDALIWVRGYLSMALSCGQANDPEEAARQILAGSVDMRVF